MESRLQVTLNIVDQVLQILSTNNKKIYITSHSFINDKKKFNYVILSNNIMMPMLKHSVMAKTRLHHNYMQC